MAFVPDLDVLESSSLSEETFYSPSCLCLQKVRMAECSGTVARCPRSTGCSAAALCLQKPRLDSEHTAVGVQVSVRKGRRSFRQAAVLVVAMTKLLRRPKCRDFADSDLSMLLEEVFEPVTFQQLQSSYAGAPAFRYTRSQSFDIFDINQKCFVLESPTQLVALHLQGPSSSQKVRLNIALYRPRGPRGSAGAGQTPVALGIKGYKLYMSCVLSGAEPTLQLEVSIPRPHPIPTSPPSGPCSPLSLSGSALQEADVTRDIDSAELTRFIFYRLDSPTEGTTRFESAAFPGWFICTSLQPRQPVGITNQPDQVNVATYKLSGR
ncbi:interleukin-1 beta-like isoform X1 [Centrocercus urophasianus]|uniref:interleukin-1 beta-like isoform X1 n=1 Tax=Centrocercus urophasianus TaxID=9002 RepID=UPI001C64795C|nr:interleukin-1 beta-like isoform X1 [Centrocercus urophasianus]